MGGGTGQDRGSLYSSPSMTSVLNTAKNNPGKKNDGIGDTKRPKRMQKFTEALEKAAAYKQQKEVDAEVDKEKDDDNEMMQILDFAKKALIFMMKYISWKVE